MIFEHIDIQLIVKKDDDTEMQQAAKSASPIKSLRFFAEL
jgi:hypothetical protein